jgi:hypothetical protein
MCRSTLTGQCTSLREMLLTCHPVWWRRLPGSHRMPAEAWQRTRYPSTTTLSADYDQRRATGPVSIGNPHKVPLRGLAERTIWRNRGSIVFQQPPVDDPTQRCPDIIANKIIAWEPDAERDSGPRKAISCIQRALAPFCERVLKGRRR